MHGALRFYERIGGKLKPPLELLADDEIDAETAQDRLDRRISSLALDIDARPPVKRFFRH